MRAKSVIAHTELRYLRDEFWLSGEFCFWRNNANYSEKTKQDLEKRMKQMTKHYKHGK
jgi:hypothetical protein